jgi:hypothetical protein
MVPKIIVIGTLPASLLFRNRLGLLRVSPFESLNEKRTSGELVMKKLTLAIAMAAMLATAAPAMAFGVHVGVGGIGVGVPGPYYGGCGYNNPCGNGYYDYYGDPGPGVVIGGGGWHGGHGHGHGHGHR